MKRIIGTDVGSYLFQPGLAGQGRIALLGTPHLALEQVVMVTDVTRGEILYSAAAGIGSGTAFTDGLLTLGADTSESDASNRIQIIVDVPDVVRFADGDAPNDLSVFGGRAQETIDGNLANVFGSASLVVPGGGLRVTNEFKDQRVAGVLRVLGDTLAIDCSGCATVAIQVAGTWAGTLLFEASTDGGNFAAVSGVPAVGAAAVASTTASGLWRFQTAAFVRIQVRVSAYTSGAPFVCLVASRLPANLLPVTGSQSALLSQKTTSLEANTYDTNMAAVLGIVSLVRTIVTDNAVAPSAPTLPTTYVSRAFASWPQLYPRLRVEIGGDQRLPLAQQIGTNELKVVLPTNVVNLLEEISMHLALLNQANIVAGCIQPPIGWQDVR
jgi:hypothetical protein